MPNCLSDPSSADTELEALVAGFVDRTLPKEAWTHQAHLRVGLWHVIRHGPRAALALLRERISRYNEAVGGVNTDTDGYHESITRFYVAIITEFVERGLPHRSVADLADQLSASLGAKDLPLRYYSKERLFSVAARRRWIAPDLEPLPAADQLD